MSPTPRETGFVQEHTSGIKRRRKNTVDPDRRYLQEICEQVSTSGGIVHSPSRHRRVPNRPQRVYECTAVWPSWGSKGGGHYPREQAQTGSASFCASLGMDFGTWSYVASGSRRFGSTTCPSLSSGQKVLQNMFFGSYFCLSSTSLSQFLPKQALVLSPLSLRPRNWKTQ